MFSVCDSEVKQMKTAEHIIETVDKLVRKYHTRDPYELCQLLGIISKENDGDISPCLFL